MEEYVIVICVICDYVRPHELGWLGTRTCFVLFCFVPIFVMVFMVVVSCLWNVVECFDFWCFWSFSLLLERKKK